MLVKIKENKKVYEISLKGWEDNQWSTNMSDDVLTDCWWLNHQTEEFREGYTLTQAEFDDFWKQLQHDVEVYNEGGTIEWFQRPSELGEDEGYDVEELAVECKLQYVDED